MIISKRQMQSIAEEIGETIHRNINIMDEQGYIIASTDASRIGVLHAGAKRILEEQLDELIIFPSDEDAETREGINLPIVIEKKIVGVVGITGEIGEVKILGQVIEKMAEILILERYRSNQKRVIDDIKKSFAVEWLFGENEEQFMTSSRLLDINLEIDRVIAVLDISFSDERSEDTREKLEKVLEYVMKKMCRSPQQLVFAMGMKVILFLNESDLYVVNEQMENIVKQLEELFHCEICCGVGLPGHTREALRRSYREAEAACEFSKNARQKKVEMYSDTDVRLLLGNISLNKRIQYIEKIFKTEDIQMVEEMVSCLRAYVDNNGSIYRAADQLYIHKNTLQYRLNKIRQITGYDPRILQEAIPLYIAMILSEFKDRKI